MAIREELQRYFGESLAAEKLLTEAEVAEILKVQRQTLSLWRSRGGKGPDYRKLSGGAIRYKYNEVMKWIDEQTVKTH